VAAQRVVDFFEQFLCHSKGRWAGKPFLLQDWQKHDFLMPLFGWKRADGTRRYRLAYVEVPKKNGKSALMSGVCLFLLVGDGEAGAEVYSAAADRKQAGIVFDEAAKMVRKSPLLNARLRVIPSTKTILYPDAESKYVVLSRESTVAEGLNIHGLAFDELHAQKSRDLWDTLRYGGAAREQPLLVSITTAGYDKHSICYEQHQYAKQVLDGVVEDDSFFAYIRAADVEQEDWTSPDVWRKANPSFGVTIDEATFASDCKEAQESPTKENAFKRYRLNIWTEQDVRWLQMDKWDACDGPVDPGELAGRACFGGLDLASTTDIAAFVLLFPEDDGYLVVPHFWVPADNARQRERKDRVPYETWGREGLVTLTPGNVIDYSAIKQTIQECGELYDIQEIAADRWNLEALRQQLCSEGLSESVVVPFGQGYASMSAPTKELERLVLDGKISHGGHPVLRWMASNVTAQQDPAGNIKPAKDKSTEKIDGIVALIMALGRAMVTGETASVYETRGVLTV